MCVRSGFVTSSKTYFPLFIQFALNKTKSVSSSFWSFYRLQEGSSRTRSTLPFTYSPSRITCFSGKPLDSASWLEHTTAISVSTFINTAIYLFLSIEETMCSSTTAICLVFTWPATTMAPVNKNNCGLCFSIFFCNYIVRLLRVIGHFKAYFGFVHPAAENESDRVLCELPALAASLASSKYSYIHPTWSVPAVPSQLNNFKIHANGVLRHNKNLYGSSLEQKIVFLRPFIVQLLE